MLRNWLTSVAIVFALLGTARANDVTYQQILANPDDLQLNYLYAQQQVIKGNLQQSSAALERVLLIQPNWDSARLFYALVLYRLGDMAGANRELTILSERPLPPAQQREVRKYLALSSSQAKTTRVSGRLSGGFRVDSNPDLTTDSVNDLNGDPLDPDQQTDGAFIAGAEFRVEHDIDDGQGSFVFFEANGDLSEQFQVDNASYLTGDVRAGANFYHGDLEFTPWGIAAAFSLDGELYRTEYGGGARFEFGVNPRFSVFAGGSGVYQDFRTVSSDSVGSDRDGWLGKATGGFVAHASETSKFYGRVTGSLKDADNGSYSYDGIEIALSHLWLMGRGQYLVTRASYRWLDYDQPDPNYSSSIVREDELFRGRIAYGLPLELLAENLNTTAPEGWADVNLQLGVNYLSQDSNIPNFDTDSFSGDIMLVKRFGD